MLTTWWDNRTKTHISIRVTNRHTVDADVQNHYTQKYKALSTSYELYNLSRNTDI